MIVGLSRSELGPGIEETTAIIDSQIEAYHLTSCSRSVLSSDFLTEPSKLISKCPLGFHDNKTEFWKSNPRKQCDFCKCWIADNKASIEFHERGKNHQENVKRRLSEVKKKAVEKRKQDELFSKEFAEMERAALKAVQKDLRNDPGIVGANDLQSLVQDSNKAQDRAEKEAVNTSTWMACQGPQGYTYYYNQQTGESQWEMPKELAEKEALSKSGDEKQSKPEDQTNLKDPQRSAKNETIANNQAEEPEHEKHPLLGGWTAVAASQTSENVKLWNSSDATKNFNENVSSSTSQMEKTRDPEVLLQESRKRTAVFKEKTVKMLPTTNSNESVGFKKRKMKNNRNVRKRDDDGD